MKLKLAYLSLLRNGMPFNKIPHKELFKCQSVNFWKVEKEHAQKLDLAYLCRKAR